MIRIKQPTYLKFVYLLAIEFASVRDVDRAAAAAEFDVSGIQNWISPRFPFTRHSGSVFDRASLNPGFSPTIVSCDRERSD